MSQNQLRFLALWAALLAGCVCVGYLTVSVLAKVLILLAAWACVAPVWFALSRKTKPAQTEQLDNLPDATYRQPVVLVCGDLPHDWPEGVSVLTVTQGCWVRVEEAQALAETARQVLYRRPGWGGQLSIMVNVCPQRHNDAEALTSQLLAVRWQIAKLRRDTGHAFPLVLSCYAGTPLVKDVLWQAVVPGEGASVWRASSLPGASAALITTGNVMDISSQVLMNSLVAWCHRYVESIFTDKNQDADVLPPAAKLWGLFPVLARGLSVSSWSDWLTMQTAMPNVAGWHPVESGAADAAILPDFILPLLPVRRSITPGERAFCWAGAIFTLAAIAALCGSAWNNRQLLLRVGFEIQHYSQIPMNDYDSKALAVGRLREHATQLDNYARNGLPAHLGLGLYRGEQLRLPLINALRSYVPPPPPPKAPKPKPAPAIIRLDSMSLFDSGKALLKPGSTKLLVNSLMGIKAKPGWLIVVSGHTDNTGNAKLNQTLSLKRAEAVRDWMRDTGDVPESCFAVQGYGAGRPAASNDTPEGRALNRRVEISLVPQADACRLPGETLALSQDDGVLKNEME
ncbi:OmpA family protein [Cedecea davisae]|uniref:OmpA family protein n=1 Tax=Cedecea davisae TaxID=158484 RepID=UPI00242E281A|nr:OmpA family protein [Cedecea davisae]